MNNWWWVQYLCGMAVMRSRKNMHLVHLFFTEIPAVFKRNVFIRKPRYFNIFFLHVFPWLPCSSAICSSHWIFRTGWWNPVCFKIFYKERLWPSLSASPWSRSCRRNWLYQMLMTVLHTDIHVSDLDSSAHSCTKKSVSDWVLPSRYLEHITVLASSRLAEHHGNSQWIMQQSVILLCKTSLLSLILGH